MPFPIELEVRKARWQRALGSEYQLYILRKKGKFWLSIDKLIHGRQFNACVRFPVSEDNVVIPGIRDIFERTKAKFEQEHPRTRIVLNTTTSTEGNA